MALLRIWITLDNLNGNVKCEHGLLEIVSTKRETLESQAHVIEKVEGAPTNCNFYHFRYFLPVFSADKIIYVFYGAIYGISYFLYENGEKEEKN